MHKEDKSSVRVINKHGPAGFMLLVVYVGAAVYFVHQSSGFWGFIAALLKAMVWPAFVIYHVLTALHA